MTFFAKHHFGKPFKGARQVFGPFGASSCFDMGSDSTASAAVQAVHTTRHGLECHPRLIMYVRIFVQTMRCPPFAHTLAQGDLVLLTHGIGGESLMLND